MAVSEARTRAGDAAMAIDDAALETFETTFRGPIIRPGDAGYDEARRVWNGMIDKRPAVIARCTGTDDVVAAIRFARASGLPVAVRGGGHNVAGNAVIDDGLVIDLSLMKEIDVDPIQRVARAQAGVVWGELDATTQKYGLATPGGVVSSTGIAGFTLAGGMALTSRKLGLACDNLLAAEVVTAEGEVVRASATEHPDLFWGIRGGGGNFGIVTRFDYRLHEVGPDVFVGFAFFALADAEQAMRTWRAYVASAPDEVTSTFLFWGMPAMPDLPVEMHGMPVAGVAGAFTGPVAEGERALQPLRELATPLVDLSGTYSYLQMQNAWDVHFPTTLRYYWKSLFLDELRDEDIAATIALAANRPSPATLFAIRHLGGAVGRVPNDATAFANRQSQFNLSLDTTWADPADDERMIGWTRQAWSAMREQTGGGVYLNFAGLGEENDLLAQAAHGSNMERLREVKRRYDPTNLFQGNVNIAP